jgi:hypothetical protein
VAGTGPKCPNCGNRRFKRTGSAFDEGVVWVECEVCKHHALVELEQAPGLQQLDRCPGDAMLWTDDEPYFWELP